MSPPEPPVRVSLPTPPKMFAFGSAPAVSLSVTVSLPPWPNTWINAVLATVGEPPITGTAPPLTRMLPAALRLIVMVLFRLSPKTVSVPLDGKNDAVVAAPAALLNPMSVQALIAAPISNQRSIRLRFRRVGGAGGEESMVGLLIMACILCSSLIAVRSLTPSRFRAVGSGDFGERRQGLGREDVGQKHPGLSPRRLDVVRPRLVALVRRAHPGAAFDGKARRGQRVRPRVSERTSVLGELAWCGQELDEFLNRPYEPLGAEFGRTVRRRTRRLEAKAERRHEQAATSAQLRPRVLHDLDIFGCHAGDDPPSARRAHPERLRTRDRQFSARYVVVGLSTAVDAALEALERRAELCSAADSELPVDPRQVRIDGPGREAQVVTDIPARAPRGGKQSDLSFALGERLDRCAPRQRRRPKAAGAVREICGAA